jgi:uncharacterized protein YfaP (DUF2135 family)
MKALPQASRTAHADGRNTLASMLSLVLALALAAAAGVLPGLTARPGGLSAGTSGSLQDAFASLPLTFVENQGQADSRAAYYAHGPGYAFHFTPDEVAILLNRGSAAAHRGEGGRADAVALSLRFLGANPDVVPEGAEPAPGVVNVFRGNDPDGWRTGVPTYAAVRYPDLWPGIDLLLRGDAGELKYEFHVAAGARPDDIRLAYAGANGLGLDHEGGLLIDTPVGELRDSPPIAYQDIGRARIPVDTHYRLSDGGADGEYGFAVGSGYRPDRPLVIDPALDYSTFLGGSSHEQAHDVAVDADGNAIVVGLTQSDDFPTTPGAVDETFNGGVMDVFVTKFNADGSGLVYSTYMGGTPAPLRRGSETPFETARAVAVDASGNAYVTGQTTSPQFPTTSGAFQPTLNATDNVANDAFVSKLSPTGSLVYSTFLGGGGFEDGRDIAVDSSGNAYVVGETGSDDFPTTSGALQASYAGGRDGFLTKLNANGSGLLYSTYLGGASELDRGDGVAVDGSGNAYIAGSTRSIDFPTTPGSFQPEHSGGGFADLFEVFVAKVDPTVAGASGLVYSTFLGTSRLDVANDIAVDSAGNAYVTGSTALSSEFPTTPGAYDTAGTSGSKGFVTKLNPSGSDLVYSTFFRVTNIVLDADGSAWLAGGTGAGAETTEDAFARENSGGSDAYLALLNAAGSAIEFGTYLGGTSGEGATGVALGPNGQVVIAGNTMSPDFPTTEGAFDRTWAGDPLIFWGDAFVAKFAPDGDGDTSTPPPPSSTTTDFSGRIDKNQTITHNLAIDGTGPVDMTLNWDESRARLSLRVRDPAGEVVFFDNSTARPKTGSFEATVTGTYRFEVINSIDRRANYTLSVTHPTGSGSSEPSAALSLLSLSPTSVTGGESSTGMVALTAAAPSGGASVLLSSSNTSAATVPSSVTVPAGQTSATFTVSTSSVSANTSSTISATYGGATRTAALEVTAAQGPELSTLTLSPNPVAGGSSSTGTVTLTAAAPSGGAEVSLVSSNTFVATVPASVNVPGGSTSATFTASTSAGDFDQSSSISASHGGVTRTVILSVTAATGGDTDPPPEDTTETATFSGRIDKERTVTHTVTIGATGQTDLDLDWDESRVDLSLRVRDPAGGVVFFDGSSSRPKRGSFDATVTGSYRFDIINNTDRRAEYTLAVTHPSG